MINCKTRGEIELMRLAGRVAGQTLEVLEPYMKPGISGNELDKIAEEFIRSKGCIPTFKGYDPPTRSYPDPKKTKNYNGYPSTICISFNEEIVHGIPGRRVLKEGDIVGVDVAATYKGWVGDTARTFIVGKTTPEAEKLVKITQQSLMVGIEQMRRGNYLYDISSAIEDFITPFGYKIVTQYCGHGVGRQMHEDPQVPNYHQDKRGVELRKGMCLALEPMVNIGTSGTKVKPDKWTVVTADGSLSAHFEHTSAVTDGDPIILTMPD